MRNRLIDENWRFQLGEEAHASERTYDDSGWRVLDLPHDWSIERERQPHHPSAEQGGFFEDGVAWYRKHLEMPEDWPGKRIHIEFEGVYRNAETWVNGHYLGLHPYGYTAFVYDVTPFLRADGSANVIAVRVDNSTHRHTRWYSGSGIYRHVRLHVLEPIHVAQWGVFVTTAEISDTQALIRIETKLENDGGDSAAVRLGLTIADPDGQTLAEKTTAATIKPGTGRSLTEQLAVPEPRLWTLDNPDLYRLETEIRNDGKVVDRVNTTFGIRHIQFSATRGFVLNGESVTMRGGCVHHDCGPLGAASIDRAEARKVQLLKANGYNAVRCAHNPPSQAFLDACDHLGMLVIDEAFDVWRARKLPYDYHRHFDDCWQRDLDSMLYRDRNHPSIVLWSIGNELVERGLPEGAESARGLAGRVRDVDPTRPVTAGICHLWDGSDWETTDPLFAQLDVCGYNYRLDVYEQDHQRRPKRVIIATESFPPEAFDYWKAAEKHPYVAGDFVWTALDYLGEAGIGHTFPQGENRKQLPGWPWNQANCGDIDLCGWKRPQSFYRDILWKRAARPYIAVHPPTPDDRQMAVSAWGWHDVQESWNWPENQQKTLRVDVYADCETVELLLNGHSVGRKPAGEPRQYIASFEVPYEPGTLRAVARNGNRTVGHHVIETSGPAETIALRPDRTTIHADPNDLAFITVEALDAESRLVPTWSIPVFFTVRGPGRIAAVANADPRNTERYRGNSHRFWRGRCLVVVQPTGQPGSIALRAQADGLAPATIDIDLNAG